MLAKMSISLVLLETLMPPSDELIQLLIFLFNIQSGESLIC